MRVLLLAFVFLLQTHYAVEAQPIVSRFDMNSVEDVAVDFSTGDVASLPETLLVRPGTYRLAEVSASGSNDGYVSDFSRSGLYQIHIPIDGSVPGIPPQTIFRIVHTNSFELVGALSWLISFGHQDNSLTIQDRVAVAVNRRLNLSCGATVLTVQSILEQNGYWFRDAHVITAGELNNYNDGHHLLEIMHNNKIIAIDPSLGVVFKSRATGELVDVVGAVEGLQSGSVEVVRLKPFMFSAENLPTGSFNPNSWILEEALWSDDGFLRAIHRLYGIPFLNDPRIDTGIIGYLPHGVTALENVPSSYRVISRDVFIASYY